MKTYKKVVVEAVNTPSGSYAAGCPVKDAGSSGGFPTGCKYCERTY